MKFLLKFVIYSLIVTLTIISLIYIAINSNFTKGLLSDYLRNLVYEHSSYDLQIDDFSLAFYPNISEAGLKLNIKFNSVSAIDSGKKVLHIDDLTTHASIFPFHEQAIHIELKTDSINFLTESDTPKVKATLSAKIDTDFKLSSIKIDEIDLVMTTKNSHNEDISLTAGISGEISDLIGELIGTIKFHDNLEHPISKEINFPDLNYLVKYNKISKGYIADLNFQQGGINALGIIDLTDDLINLSIKSTDYYNHSDLINKIDNSLNSTDLSLNKQSVEDSIIRTSYNLKTQDLNSNIHLKDLDLLSLQEFVPNLKNGLLNLTAKFDLNLKDYIYHANLNMSLSKLDSEILQIDDFKLNAKAESNIPLLLEDLNASGKNLIYNNMVLDDFDIQTSSSKSDRDTLSSSCKLSLSAPYAASLKSSQKIHSRKEGVSVYISDLDAILEQSKLTLPNPLFIDLSGGIKINAPFIKLDGSKVTISIDISNPKTIYNDPLNQSTKKSRSILGKIETDNLSLKFLEKLLGTTFSLSPKFGGMILLKGDLSNPIIESKINITNLSLSPQEFDDDNYHGENQLTKETTSDYIARIKAEKRISKGGINTFSKDNSINITSVIERNKIVANAKINSGKKNIGSLNFELPILFDLDNSRFTLFRNKDFTIELNLNDKVELLSLIPMPLGHSIRGIVEGGVVAKGVLDKIILSGSLKLTDGKYSYKPLGVRIIDVSSNIRGKKGDLVFENIYMADKFGHKITGSGKIEIANGFLYSVNLNTDNFELLNSPHLQGAIIGEACLVGNATTSKLTGDLLIGPMEIKIPQRLKQDIPEINITKVIDPKATFNIPDSAKKTGSDYNFSKPYEMIFDVNVETYDYALDKNNKRINNSPSAQNTPQKTKTLLSLSNYFSNKKLEEDKNKYVFIRGWGVDTRLKGLLKITGSLETPLINGKLTSVDGKYSEFGRELGIERGILRFEGSIPPSPFIDIVGFMKEGDTELRVTLGGSIYNPEINLSSNPAMNKEEALSMILFGSNPDQISAFQAFQLANSMRRLNGGQESPDILQASKKAIGIDDISIRKNSKDPSKTSIAIGKRLSEKFYIEVEQSTSDETQTKLQVEISPQINIEGSTNNQGTSNIGINWKKDY